MALEMVSHEAIAKAQETCQDVKDHKQGLKPRSVEMQEVEFGDNVHLYCEIANGKTVLDADKCIVAAKKLGKKFVKLEQDSTSGPGCYAHASNPSKVYFNELL